MNIVPVSLLKNEKVMLTFISFIAVLFTLILTLIAAFQGNSIVIWSRFCSYFIDASLLFFSFMVTQLNQSRSKLLFEFGLGKLESFAGILLLVAVIFYICIIIAAVSYRIIHPEPLAQDTFAVFLYLIFIAKDVYLYKKLSAYTSHQKSVMINSQKRYYIISLISNTLVLLPIILAYMLAPTSLFPMTIDILTALSLCFVTAYLSYGAGKRAACDLLDTALDESIQFEILKQLAKHYDLYEQFHGQFTRQSGNIKHIELFFEFNTQKPFGEVMSSIEMLQKDIQKAIPDSRVFIIPATKRIE